MICSTRIETQISRIVLELIRNPDPAGAVAAFWRELADAVGPTGLRQRLGLRRLRGNVLRDVADRLRWDGSFRPAARFGASALFTDPTQFRHTRFVLRWGHACLASGRSLFARRLSPETGG
jgi:hypothetical protein